MNTEQWTKHLNELEASETFEGFAESESLRLGVVKCLSCAFKIDMESAVPCASHKWHIHPDAPWGIYIGALDDWDMCCLCGKDAEAVMK